MLNEEEITMLIEMSDALEILEKSMKMVTGYSYEDGQCQSLSNLYTILKNHVSAKWRESKSDDDFDQFMEIVLDSKKTPMQRAKELLGEQDTNSLDMDGNFICHPYC